MLFWIKHLGLAIALIILGVWLMLSYDPNALQESKTNIAQKEASGGAESKDPAKGLSNFTAELMKQFELSDNPERERYVVELKQLNSTLDKELQRLAEVSKPVSGFWVGRIKNRKFKTGSTLKTMLDSIAAEEKMNLVWWLDRDFVIKDDFRVEESAVGTLYKIVRAIDSDFEKEVHGYFCPDQRALVITDKPTYYTDSACAKAKPSRKDSWGLRG